jgi:DNA topoisomerase II
MNNPETLDIVEFNLLRTVNTGSKLLVNKMLWKPVEDRYVREEVIRSDAVLKVIDEIITNAEDAAAGKIEINFDGKLFSVRNYGKFIALDKVESAFSSEYSSTNFRDDGNGTTGGLNGIGAKLTNIFSRYFSVEVSTGQKVLNMVFTDNMRNREGPVVTDRVGEPYVWIRFELDYDKLCRAESSVDNSGWIEGKIDLIRNLTARRAHEVAAYLHSRATVYFAGQLIDMPFQKFVDWHRTSAEDSSVVMTVGAEYPFRLGIIVRDPVKNSRGISTPAGFEHVTILNGVLLEQKNNVYSLFIKQFTDYFRAHPTFEKYAIRKLDPKVEFPKKLFVNNIIIIILGAIPRSEFEFGSQNKSSINISRGSMDRFKKNYAIAAEDMDKVWRATRSIYNKIIMPSNKNQKVAVGRLYEAAVIVKNGGTGNHIVIGEGNSALTLFRKLFGTNKSLGFHENGLYSIQGVPINAVKHSKLLEAGPMMMEKLEKNIGIQGLVNILGLRYDKECTPKYRKIVIGTDQDTDGIGKICSLILCFFLLYFPYLVRAGYLYRYRTPIIRVKSKKLHRNFYSEQEFETSGININPQDITYYKGLGSHEGDDIKEMSKNFHNDIIKFHWDELGEILMHKLYGSETDGRKEELLKFDEKKLRTYRRDLDVYISEHFLNESIAEQAGNNFRMLPGLDGLVPCQRKILATMRGSESYKRKICVATLSGAVKNAMKYDHGLEALEGSIKGLAQVYEGSNNFPILLPVSDSIGTKNGGIKESASARYTNVCYNRYMDVYFPREDDDLLLYKMEECAYYEPVHYVPVIPRTLTEFSKNVGTGWNCNFAARRISSVIRYVRISIETYPYIICGNMHGDIETGSEIVVNGSREVGIGKYEIKGPLELHIVDLPPGLTGVKVEKHMKMDFVEDLSNHHNGKNIHIILRLRTGWQEAARSASTKPYLDPIVEYFGIYKIYARNMNFYGESSLVQYKCVYDIFADWFRRRRELYLKRIDKKLVYLEARWIEMECTYHFLNNDKGTVEGMPVEEQNAHLDKVHVEYTTGYKAVGYRRLNTENISMSRRMQAAELREAIYENGSFDYILDLKKRYTATEYIKKYRVRLDAALLELEEYRGKTWKSVWLEELRAVEKYYEFGKKNEWNYKIINCK